jgi:glycosyltransferase involved in cell wall biosynthesis
MSIRVSVLIPTFNSERTLSLILSSINKVSRDIIEVLIADGGSCDKLLKLLEPTELEL